jgi:uncharacterized membrane protein
MYRLVSGRFTRHMMIDGYPRALTLAGLLGAGLMAGTYFAFSTFVMPGLRRLRPGDGLVAMQAINKAAPTPLLILALVGTGLVSLLLGISAVRRLDEPAAAWQLAGAAVYLLSLVLTIAYHIPHNDALNLVDPASAGAGQAWLDYARPWTLLNHVRTVAALASTACFALALRL